MLDTADELDGPLGGPDRSRARHEGAATYLQDEWPELDVSEEVAERLTRRPSRDECEVSVALPLGEPAQIIGDARARGCEQPFGVTSVVVPGIDVMRTLKHGLANIYEVGPVGRFSSSGEV